MGYPKRGTRRKDERFDDLETIGVSSGFVKVNTEWWILGDNVTDLRLNLGVERRTVKTKHVVVCLQKLNSEGEKKRINFISRIKYAQAHSEDGQGSGTTDIKEIE
jgi:hypothetical protein